MMLEELAKSPGYTVGTRIAAELLGTTQWNLTLNAKFGHMDMPHFFSGNRLHISKAALLKKCGWKKKAEG